MDMSPIRTRDAAVLDRPQYRCLQAQLDAVSSPTFGRGSAAEPPIILVRNGLGRPIGPANPRERASHEALIRDDYARCHPGEDLDALKARARFSKEDKGLYADWMALAAGRAAARRGGGGGPAGAAADVAGPVP